MNSNANYFVLLLLIILFMLLYVYIDGDRNKISGSKETFECKSQSSYILPKDKLQIIQGTPVPTSPSDPVKYDNDPSAPSTDGKNGPNQMFMFAFNRASPECCPSSYSTSQGCVCMTNDQTNFISQRGNNNKFNKCSSNDF